MQEPRPNACDFIEPREFLREYLTYRKRYNKFYSLRNFSRDLGFKSPGFLSEIIAGKKKFTSSLIFKLDQIIKFTKDEKRHILYRCFPMEADSKLYQNMQESFLGLSTEQIRRYKENLEKFEIIKEWYHITILEMTEMKDFRPEGQWISEKLGHKIPPFVAEGALKRLLKVGLLCEKNGKLRKTNKDIFFGENIPSHAVALYHKQGLSLANLSLENDPVSEREFTGTTIAIDSNNFAKVKKLIDDFNMDLHRLAKQDSAGTVLRINVQAFVVAPADTPINPLREDYYQSDSLASTAPSKLQM